MADGIQVLVSDTWKVLLHHVVAMYQEGSDLFTAVLPMISQHKCSGVITACYGSQYGLSDSPGGFIHGKQTEEEEEEWRWICRTSQQPSCAGTAGVIGYIGIVPREGL